MSLLELKNVTLRFGGLTAVDDVSLAVEEKEIFAVIGPNGAGKTSLFNTITGLYQPTDGVILFRGRPIERTFRSRTVYGLLLVSFLSALGAFLSTHIEALWEASISANYVYQEPFPWQKAFMDALRLSRDLLHGTGWVFPLLSAGAGLCGGYLVWKRSKRTAELVARAGVARTFQNIRLFDQLTVLENVIIGMDRKLRTNLFHAVLRLPLYFKEKRLSEKKARELLAFVQLGELESEQAENLPYGLQRRLEIARALASDPQLLLLDEPAAGMNPTEAEELMVLIKKIREKGVTILLIEHHMKVVLGISDRIAVLDYGNKIAEGNPQEVCANPDVISAYLGATC